MTFDQIIDTIRVSVPDDWHLELSDFGASFHSKFKSYESAGETYIEVHSHSHHATLKSDVSLVIEFGMDEWPKEFVEPWLKEFSNSEPAIRQCAEIFYNGSLVARYLYLLVDGVRFALPIPNRQMEVTREKYDIIKLIHSLDNGGYEYEEGVQTAKIRVV